MSIAMPLLLAAFLEWFLFLAAFMYCFVKAYQKADRWSIKALAVILIIIFSMLRGIFLPVMLVTLPLPAQITRRYPKRMVSVLQWFAFWTFATLLTLPWLFCVYRVVTNSLGRTKRIKNALDDRTAPKTVIVIPVYKEDPEILIKAIDSVVRSDYPSACIHVFLSYDGDAIDESYLQVIHHLRIPIAFKDHPRSIDVTYRGARITVSRFEHGGKRHCQKQTFKLIDRVYSEYLKHNDNLFMLFIDSDCILDKLALQNFMYDMDLKPGSKSNMLAMTGIITSTTENNSLLTVLQDMEYIHGQLLERSVESGCGAVTCLPGALTILRFSAFRKMAKYYFMDKAEQCDDLFDFGKCHLGEDRWLTHLLMIGAKERYQIQMCTSAFCKTEAVQTFRSLLKQRRRWFLGYLTNEVCMLTDTRLWRRYPLLCLVRLAQDTVRTTSLLFPVMVISLITTSHRVEDLPVGFIGVSLGLNYLLMLYFGAKLKRYKAWLYPLMFILNPFFNWLYVVYGVLTSGQRTWGGPRADAAKADEDATFAGQTLQTKEQDKELGTWIYPFRTNTDEEKPSVRFENHTEQAFPSHHPEIYKSKQYDLDTSVPRLVANPVDIPLHPYCSANSAQTWDSGSDTICLPQHVECLTGVGDPVKHVRTRRAHDSVAALSQCSCKDVDDTLESLISQPTGYTELSSTISPIVPCHGTRKQRTAAKDNSGRVPIPLNYQDFGPRYPQPRAARGLYERDLGLGRHQDHLGTPI
ncbi:chitin synthase D [Aspergillus taichungensis]|uniref:chitin synthase n=1 Tax=Aspergillus taichungensis TaxID=482145 RepID=A0A2J5HEA8_9EURO|nr:chitin synthase D [Aspergillus taichungensis]